MKRPNTVQSIAPLLRVEPESGLSLQAQLRTRIIEAIASSVLAPGTKLPSSRRLSEELGIARNTVNLAYQQLIAEGHLAARERSGVFVSQSGTRTKGDVGAGVVAGPEMRSASVAKGRMLNPIQVQDRFRCPPDWQKYRYPFIEGRYDRSLFPVAEWREASRLALGVREVDEWSIDNGDADDEMLIEQIRTKLLPRRGISARPDEILITVGEQQALYLITELFSGPGAVAGIEEPGLPEMRDLLRLRGAAMRSLPIDDEGLLVDASLKGCDLVYATPSRQRPTGVTMSLERRKALVEAAQTEDFLIIEDDFECELNYLRDALPSMRCLEGGERVLYAASLSKVLAPGVRLGFLVAPADVTAAARRLRDMTTRRASPNNQRTAAFFLSLGHYDAMLNRLNKIFEERLIALRDALNHYRPLSIAIPPVAGGTSYWVKGPEGLDTDRLLKEAEAQGILIEPAAYYFANPMGRRNMFRLGVTSLPAEQIRPGVELLSRVIKDLAGQKASAAAPARKWLDGAALKDAMSGATLLYKTVYGEPCTIELLPDGVMLGRAGYANEDRDTGEWSVCEDLWVRRWRNWAYGEAAEYHVVIEGDALSWLNKEGECVDSAIIVARNQGADDGPPGD